MATLSLGSENLRPLEKDLEIYLFLEWLWQNLDYFNDSDHKHIMDVYRGYTGRKDPYVDSVGALLQLWHIINNISDTFGTYRRDILYALEKYYGTDYLSLFQEPLNLQRLNKKDPYW